MKETRNESNSSQHSHNGGNNSASSLIKTAQHRAEFERDVSTGSPQTQLVPENPVLS